MMYPILRTLTLTLIIGFIFPRFVRSQEIVYLEPDEKVWAGIINEGHLMPYNGSHQFDFGGENLMNQLQPLLLTNKGRFIWSEKPFRFELVGNKIVISNNSGSIQKGVHGTSLADVQKYVSGKFLSPSGKYPDTLLFSSPQYNTWIELTYNQNQTDILKYARAIINNGLPPGVIMIDDTWQEDYGLWKFHPGRFSKPKMMIDSLHQMGFKVMLWICPFVSADQFLIYKKLKDQKAFLLEKKSPVQTWEQAEEPAMIRWWNGVSAVLDFSNPKAVTWFESQLLQLVSEYKVDGFKFDAGDLQFYPKNTVSMANVDANTQAELYTQFGLKYPLNEYRACWKMGGQPLAQRLCDKAHSWEDMQKLIPDMTLTGLFGYTFSCPDMIGGGDFVTFLNLSAIDQELVVRSAQIHALMPMMQFSVAPWRILNQVNLNAVKKAVTVRMKFTPLILELVKTSAISGEPIVRNLEYVFPHQGFEDIKDQFMLGDKMLVAPVVEKGQRYRNVILPEGKWKGDDNQIYQGGKSYLINVPIDRIPYFERI